MLFIKLTLLSGLNDDQTCRQKAIKINSDAKECLKRNTGFPKPNSEALESLIKG